MGLLEFTHKILYYPFIYLLIKYKQIDKGAVYIFEKKYIYF